LKKKKIRDLKNSWGGFLLEFLGSTTMPPQERWVFRMQDGGKSAEEGSIYRVK